MKTKENIIEAENLSAIFGAKQNNGGSFTVESLVTGKDYTFKVANKVWKGVTYTHVSVEVNYLDWSYLGIFFNGKIFHKKQLVNSPSAVAIAWLISRVKEGKFALLNEKVKVMHLGNCIRCGKTLTDVQSIERGLGSECAKNLGVSTTKVSKPKVSKPKVSEVVVSEEKIYSIYAKFTTEYRLAMNQSRLEHEHHLTWNEAVQLKDEYNLYRLNDCTEYFYIDKSE